MTLPTLDATAYIRPPRLGVRSALSLSKMLLLKVPKKPGPGVIMAAKALAAAIDTLETAWRSQGKGKGKNKGKGNARPADLRVDRAHAAVHGRLTNYEIFALEHPDRVQASELLARLYATGLDFLRLPWIEEHAESERRLQIIETEDLYAELERLVGAVFIDELLAAHEAYGVALGITEVVDEPRPEVSMVDPLRAISQAIADYALHVLAFGKLDARHVAPALRALAPIDAFRHAASKRSSGGGSAAAGDEDDDGLPEGAPAPDSPVPAVEDE